MAFNSTQYSGVFPDLKADYINLPLLFNTMDKDSLAKTSNFMVAVGGKINVGGSAIGTCNKIPVNCNSAGQFDVTATEPLSVNDLFDDCIVKLDNSIVARTFDVTARAWVETEATYGYSNMALAGDDITTAIAGDTTIINARQEIIYGIKQLADQGYATADMVVAVNTNMYFALADLEIGCCNVNIQDQQTGSALVNKFGVRAVVHVPTNILSGNLTGGALTPAETVRFAVYIHDYALLKTQCEVTPFIRDVNSPDYVGTMAGGQVAMISGKENIGFGLFDNTSAKVCFEGSAATMATPKGLNK